MWAGIIVMAVVLLLAVIAVWTSGPGSRKPRRSRSASGVQPGRDYNAY